MTTFPFALIKHMMQRKSVQGKVVASVMRVSPNTAKATNLMVYNSDVRRAIGAYSRNPTLTMIPNNLFAASIHNNNNNSMLLVSSSLSLMGKQKLFSTNECIGSDGSKKIAKKEIDNRNSRRHLKELREKLSICLDKPDHAPDEATNILQQMLRHHPRTVHVDDCNKIIRAWNKVSSQDNGPKDAPKKALNVLKQMIKIGNVNNNSDVRPTVTSYNLVNEAFAYKGDINNSKLVFNMLQKDFKTNKNLNVKPNGNSYLNMIYACSRSGNKNAPETAKRILATMIELNKNGELKDRPNLVDYKTTMNACARNGDVDGALSLLETIENDEKMKPDVKVYNVLINALSKSRDVGSPNKAINLLNKMHDLYREGTLEDGPDEVTYDSVMDTCAAHGDIQSANLVLKIMMDHSNAGNNNAKPGAMMYYILINVISKSKHDTAPNQAKNLLKLVLKMHLNGRLEGSLNAIAYNSVIDAYASHGDIQGARDVLIMMENDFKSGNKDAKPNMITYTTLINAWSKSKLDIAPYEAMNLLKKMAGFYQEGILDEGPDVITYNSVIDAYASHGDVQGARDVLAIMEKDFKSGNDDAKPNVITYTSLINAYASRGDIQGANDILVMMENNFKLGDKNAKPDMIMYSTLINVWSKSGENDAPYQAKKILKNMITMYSEGHLTKGPNTIAFNSVINAYAEQGDPDGANNILEMMEDYVKSGNNDTKPDIRTYTTLIKAWYKSNDKHAPKEAENIFRKIKDRYQSGDLKEGPDNVTYKLMISCLRKFKGCKKRINQLQLMLKDVRK